MLRQRNIQKPLNNQVEILVIHIARWERKQKSSTFAKIMNSPRGEMAEWSNAPDSKSGIRLVRIEGSNPSLSANLT